MTNNETDYRDVFAKRADYVRAHPSHRKRTLLGREEQNFASGYADYLKGKYISGGAPVDAGKRLTIPETAATIHLSRWRVWQFVKSGRLTAEKVGRDWLVSQDSLDQFAQAQRKPGRPRNPGGEARCAPQSNGTVGRSNTLTESNRPR